MIKPKIKILSIDGGGIRGIIPCIILQYIREELGMPLHTAFDLFAGTSTGGIIALGLTKEDESSFANKYEPEDMLDFYKDNGKKIFNKRLTEKEKTIAEKVMSKSKKYKKLVNEPFPSGNLEWLLQDKFGDSLLSESLSNVLITSFDIQKNQTIYYNSRTAQGERDKLIRDVGRATSAAPTYFKPFRSELGEEHLGLIDGGVFANNPSILAYCEGKELLKSNSGYKTLSSKSEDLPIMPFDDDLPIFMLSIGTGKCEKSINVNHAEKFLTRDWISPLVENIFMDSAAENTHFAMQHLMPHYSHGQKRYFRIEIDDLPVENSDMSDASEENIAKLTEKANQWLQDERNQEKLNEIISILKES